MRKLYPFLPLLLAGCASGAATGVPASAPAQRSVVQIESQDGVQSVVERTVEANIVTRTIPGTPDQHWTPLVGFYQHLDVDLNTVNTAARVIGTQNQRVRRILDKRPSAFLECGAGLTGAYADQYDVYLSAVTQLTPAEGGGTLVRTQLEAYAKDSAHNNVPIRCASKRILENRIIEVLEAHTATGP